MRPSSPRVMLPTILAIGLFWTALAGAAPTVGFIEEWPGTSLSTWSGGTPDFNPGTGGFLGAGDGYLGLSNTFLGQFGTTSAGLEYAGNWQAAGITHVIFSLNNLTTNDPIEIHFGIGRDVHTVSPNFWQYNIGFIPPVNAWKQFDVDLTSANFTRIIGTGTLDDALKNAQRIHLRHDQAPFVQSPNPIIGDMGIDHLVLANSPLAVESAPGVTTGRPVQLAPPAPNPSRGPVTFGLESFESGPVHLQIVDASGRLVRQVELPDAGAGARSWGWDGADDRGRPVAPGVYRVRAWGRSGGTSRPFVRVR